MFTWTWIEKIAAIAGIVMAAAAFSKYLLPMLKRVDLQDPRMPVKKPILSWDDVVEGVVKVMLPHAREFNPDIIFGINRGGAIVGGIIAKKLNIPQVSILDINFDREVTVVEQRQDKNLPGIRVLLVDDACRTSSHMKEAERYLISEYRRIELRRMVVLCLRTEKIGPERTSRTSPVECYAFFTYDGRVKLPWDP